MKIIFGDFFAQLLREDIFNPTSENNSLHERSNASGLENEVSRIQDVIVTTRKSKEMILETYWKASMNLRNEVTSL